MNHFKKSYKAIVKYFLQKLQGFSSIIGVFLSLFDMGRSVQVDPDGHFLIVGRMGIFSRSRMGIFRRSDGHFS